jgi:sulfite reductase (NADPH) flavoprotein alpha-component
MNILLLFATNSGATALVTDLVNQSLTGAGHSVSVKNPQEASFEDIQASDVLILASPSWDFADKQGQPHQDYLGFFEKMEGKQTPGKKCAVVGLGDSSYSVFCGAADHLEEFVKKFQGELVVPTLRIDGFYFDQGKNEQLVKDWAQSLVSKIAA